MKNEEDEAFDELAKRQGAWGGGFPAKRKMVMDKVHAEFYEKYVRYRTAPRRIEEDDDTQVYKKPWVGLTDQESIDIIAKDNNHKYPIQLLQAVMDALKAKNT